MSLFLRCRVSCLGSLTAVSAAVLFVFLGGAAPSASAQMDEWPSSGLIRTDRYTLTRTGPTEDQVRPLEAMVNVSFSPSVRTVGQAIQELLQGSGYRLIHRKGEFGEPVDTVLMQQSLPATQYKLGPMALRDALATLGGSAWHLHSNEFGREVWFELDPRYLEDSDRVRRLLSTTMVERSSSTSTGESGHETPSTYIEFVPGRSDVGALTPSGRAALNDWLSWYRDNEGSVSSVSLVGESQSTGNHAREALADDRARSVAETLRKAGIPADLITYSSVNKNYASENRQGVYLVADTVSSEAITDRHPGTSGSTARRTEDQRPSDSSVVEPADIFYLYKGEDLEVALRRWAAKAQYSNVVWNVRNKDGQFVRIPIRADAVFRGDLRQTLAHLKEAYATAPRPLYLDIELREGNKIVYVELLHYGD